MCGGEYLEVVGRLQKVPGPGGGDRSRRGCTRSSLPPEDSEVVGERRRRLEKWELDGVGPASQVGQRRLRLLGWRPLGPAVEIDIH